MSLPLRSSNDVDRVEIFSLRQNIYFETTMLNLSNLLQSSKQLCLGLGREIRIIFIEWLLLERKTYFMATYFGASGGKFCSHSSSKNTIIRKFSHGYAYSNFFHINILHNKFYKYDDKSGRNWNYDGTLEHVFSTKLVTGKIYLYPCQKYFAGLALA